MIVVNYELNKEYISKNLCENKAKPMMHCNGKCHLRKQLQKEDKKENSPSNNIKEKFEIQFFSGSQLTYISFHDQEKETQDTPYIFNNYDKHLKNVYLPPRA
jgi:hypothetical protein